MDIIAFAMGQGASGGGAQGSSFGAFIPLLLILLLFIGFRALYKHGKKTGSAGSYPQSTRCEDCGLTYTEGEKFCRKCGNPLGKGF